MFRRIIVPADQALKALEEKEGKTAKPVFISYSQRASRVDASALAARLGNLAFFDSEAVEDGDEFPRSIFDALLDAQITVIVATGEYAKSRWCQLELRLAVFGSDESASRIVIALGDGSQTVLDAMPPAVAIVNWPASAESERLAGLVLKQLEQAGRPLRSRLGEDAAERLWLAYREETSLPQPRKLEVPRSLPEAMGLQSIGPRFVGRAAKLREIHRLLFDGASAPVAARIVGGPGSGKTRLAAEYLNRYGNYYPGGVFWIDAAAPSLDEEFWRVLSDLDPTVPELARLREEKVDLKRKFGRALRAIGKPVLYVIDNVPEAGPGESPRGLPEFCPAVGSVTVLATSRQDPHETGVRVIEVESLARQAAVLLLTDRIAGAARLKWEKWEKLSSWVGDLPLALDSMNASLALGSETAGELLEAAEKESNPAEELDEIERSLRDLVPAGAVVGVTKTFRISFDTLPRSAQDLAYVLAHLAPAPVPMEFVLSLPEQLNTGAARAALRSHRFVAGGNEMVFGLMPRLMSAFLRALRRADSAALLKAVGGRLGAEMQPARFGDPKQWPLLNLYRVHAEFLFDRITGLPSFDAELVRLGSLAARISVEQGDFAEAKRLQEHVLDVSKRLLGEMHPETLTATNNLTATLAALGDLAQARELGDRLLESTRHVHGEESPETLAAMNNLAETLRAQGEFSGARNLQEQVLAANMRIGPDRQETLAAMNNLALTMEAQGDLPGAISQLEAVAGADEHVLGTDSPARLRGLNNLAGLRRRVGDLAGARKLSEEIVASCRGSLGEEHPVTLLAIHTLAATMLAQGELAGAREREESVVEARKRILGDDHPDTLTAINNLASIMGRQGDLKGELTLEESLLRTRTRVLGEEHPDTVTTVNNLALTLRALGDFPRAKQVLLGALEAVDRLLGNDHPLTLTLMDNLAEILVAEGDFAGARQLEERAFGLSWRILGPDHPDTLMAAGHLADTLRLQGDFAGAQTLQEFVLQTQTRVLGEMHPDTLTAMSNLGVTLIQTGHTQEGVGLIRKTYEGRRKVLGEEHPDTVMAQRVLQNFAAGQSA